MAQHTTIHQSLEKITISYLNEISGLKKQISELEVEVEQRENELAKAKIRIGELGEQLKKK
ncbi:MAG TPA: hypothetical protein VKA27_08195 [Sunxiuqinia sp.]|nr:hypothetical protein [Sunxiuqinia sp.]